MRMIVLEMMTMMSSSMTPSTTPTIMMLLSKVRSTLAGLPLGFLTTVLVFSPSSFLSTSWGLEASTFLLCLEAEAEGVTVSFVEVVASLAGLQIDIVKVLKIIVL